MARVFTITPGLENMGAMKTGGQGSVYKARRMGEIISAVKILPTPIYSESEQDKNYSAFLNEVNKLKKVNEHPNPNVVKILNSGLTESGNLPFIEMEYIEGPDLEDLLKPPHDAIFTIKEVLKVAEQLSGALAHCHKLDVKHGDIKSNNVKFSNQTANYVLLDFGLAIMSDEERRSSLKQAGAIEFMAPEQITGQMLFQTDIYSFGIVLYELLAGTVPFPLKDKSESARNEVRLAHMVNPVPDLLLNRQQFLPDSWDEQKKQHEMNVPAWLISLIQRCLEKKPAARFENGVELHQFIVQNFINSEKYKVNTEGISIKEQENKALLDDQKKLQNEVERLRRDVLNKDKEIEHINKLLYDANNKLNILAREKALPLNTGVSKTSFTLLVFVTIALAAFSIFSAVNSSSSVKKQRLETTGSSVKETGLEEADESNSKVPAENKSKKESAKKVVKEPTQGNKPATEKIEDKDVAQKENKQTEETEPPLVDQPEQRLPENNTKKAEKPVEETLPEVENRSEEKIPPVRNTHPQLVKQYKIVAKAYFYTEPNETAKGNMFIGPWENAVVNALSEKYGFVLVDIKTPQGETFRGWLRKKDLKLYSIN